MAENPSLELTCDHCASGEQVEEVLGWQLGDALCSLIMCKRCVPVVHFALQCSRQWTREPRSTVVFDAVTHMIENGASPEDVIKFLSEQD